MRRVMIFAIAGCKRRKIGKGKRSLALSRIIYCSSLSLTYADSLSTISHFRMNELVPCGWEIQVSPSLSVSFRVSFVIARGITQMHVNVNRKDFEKWKRKCDTTHRRGISIFFQHFKMKTDGLEYTYSRGDSACARRQNTHTLLLLI